MKTRVNVDFKILDSIDVNKALKPIAYALDQKDIRFKSRLKNRLFKQLIHSNINVNHSEVDFLFFSQMERKDYTNLLNAVSDSLGNNISKELIWYDKRTHEEIMDLALIEIFYKSRVIWKKIESACLTTRYCLFLHVCLMVVNLEKILRFKPKVVVFFADMQPIENFCSQYLNFIPSVKTVTLQHGLYVEYLNYDTINTVNYTNQVSEYFLSWGKSTSDLIKKYNPATKTIICGKPVNYVSGRKLDDYITVVFDQPIFDDYNAEMYRISLAFAEKYGKNLCVRFHPNSDKNKFKLIFGEMNDEIKETSSSLYICHTSTVLVELMHLNHNVAIFDSEIPTLDYPNELKFNSVTSLEKVIINTKQLNTFELSKGYIDCAGLKSKHEYGIALNKILNA